jgi:hypothetical protein
MAAIQRRLFRWFGRRCDGLEDLLPNAPLAPAGETIVDRLVRAIFPRAIHPTTAGLARQLRFLSSLRAETKLEVCARLQHMHDPTQNQPIVIPARSRLVSRQMRRDLRPLLIVEPKQMRFHRLAPISVDQPLESKHG